MFKQDLLSATAVAAACTALMLPAGAGAPLRLSDQLVVGGLRSPTSLAVLPDGRVLVAELEGRVRVVRRGRLLPRPLVDLSRRVAWKGERGLVAIAVDPRFSRTHALYVYYAYDAGRSSTRASMRLSRLTVPGVFASPRSERVLLGRASRGSCDGLPPGADCIPADCACHVGAGIGFDRRGNLLLSTGDGVSQNTINAGALRAQDVDSLAGKLLRVTPAGRGVRDNPFWTGRARDNRSKVWALGLRNPFRLTVRPVSGLVLVGDVGWRHWEEIDVAGRGRNLGWPCFEGRRSPPGYARLGVCRALARTERLTPPVRLRPRAGSRRGGRRLPLRQRVSAPLPAYVCLRRLRPRLDPVGTSRRPRPAPG